MNADHASTDATDSGLEYREMQAGDERSASELIVRSFQEFISPRYPRSGVRDFLTYVSPAALLERTRRDHQILVAVDGSRVVAIVDVDDKQHIDLLFVDKAYHGRGIARELVRRVVEMALEARPDLKELTADTSDFALPMYESMGFRPAGPELVQHGRHFRRVRLKLKRHGRR